MKVLYILSLWQIRQNNKTIETPFKKRNLIIILNADHGYGNYDGGYGGGRSNSRGKGTFVGGVVF